MNRFPVDQTTLRLQAVQASPKLRDGTQAVDALGIPLWTVQVLVTTADEVKAQLIEVSIPSATMPSITPLAYIRFDALVARLWQMNGRSGVALSASRLHVAGEVA